MDVRLFIGSSSESTDVADALQIGLARRNGIRPKPWTGGTFEPSGIILESLLRAVEHADCGVFVFAPDDVTLLRGAKRATARDNVVFELGLFMGALGRARTFVLRPQDVELHVPSDLLGLTTVGYRSDWFGQEPDGALEPAVAEIARAVAKLGPRSPAGPEVAEPEGSDGDPDAARREILRSMLADPDQPWRTFVRLQRAVRVSDERTRELLLAVGARGSRSSGTELWGLRERVGD
jgi:hypothetical protein